MMGGPVPTLGYPSRTAAIEAFRAEKLNTVQIARRIGIKPKDVVALESSKIRTRKQHGRPIRARGNSNTISFDYDLRQTLRPHAVRREISVEALARQILETVGYDNLVDAVLDDDAGGAS